MSQREATLKKNLSLASAKANAWERNIATNAQASKYFSELDLQVNRLMEDVEDVIAETEDKELKFVFDDLDEAMLRVLDLVLTADADSDAPPDFTADALRPDMLELEDLFQELIDHPLFKSYMSEDTDDESHFSSPADEAMPEEVRQENELNELAKNLQRFLGDALDMETMKLVLGFDSNFEFEVIESMKEVYTSTLELKESDDEIARLEKELSLFSSKLNDERISDIEELKQLGIDEANMESSEDCEEQKLQAEKLEAERLENERKEQERLESERREEEIRKELERLEQVRIENGRLERERIEFERVEGEKREQERLERERLEADRREAERKEREEIARVKAEAERVERERAEAERLQALQVYEELRAQEAQREREESERLEAERRLEEARVESERREAERAERERLEFERAEALRVEQERLEFERERERLERERIEAERIEKARQEAARLERERQEAIKAAQERIELLRREMERKEAEKKEAERREAVEKQDEARVDMIAKWRQIELEAEKMEIQVMQKRPSVKAVPNNAQAEEDRAKREKMVAESARVERERAERERVERETREQLERVRQEAAAAEAKEEEKRQAIQKWKQMEAERAARMQQRKNKRIGEPDQAGPAPESSPAPVQPLSASGSARADPSAVGRRVPTSAARGIAKEREGRVARKTPDGTPSPARQAPSRTAQLAKSGNDAQVQVASPVTPSTPEGAKPNALSNSGGPIGSPRNEDKIRAKKLPPIPPRTSQGSPSAASVSKTSNNTNDGPVDCLSEAEKQRVLLARKAAKLEKEKELAARRAAAKEKRESLLMQKGNGQQDADTTATQANAVAIPSIDELEVQVCRTCQKPMARPNFCSTCEVERTVRLSFVHSSSPYQHEVHANTTSSSSTNYTAMPRKAMSTAGKGLLGVPKRIRRPSDAKSSSKMGSPTQPSPPEVNRDGMNQKEMAAFALFEQLQKRENQNIESIKKGKDELTSSGKDLHHHGLHSHTNSSSPVADNEKERAAMALFEQLQKRETENKGALKQNLKRSTTNEKSPPTVTIEPHREEKKPIEDGLNEKQLEAIRLLQNLQQQESARLGDAKPIGSSSGSEGSKKESGVGKLFNRGSSKKTEKEKNRITSPRAEKKDKEKDKDKDSKSSTPVDSPLKSPKRRGSHIGGK